MKNDIGRMWEVANDPNATSLDRWNAMCSYRRGAGGILLPPPRELTWSYYQSPWVETRLRQALERRERKRFTRRTGIAFFDSVPMGELCGHDFVRGPDGVNHRGELFSRHVCRICGVYAREALS